MGDPLEWFWKVTENNVQELLKSPIMETHFMEIINTCTKKELQIIIDARNRETEHIGEGRIDYTGKWSKWQRYIDVLSDLPPDQQEEMLNNITMTANGEIEMIKMKKVFSLLTANHDGKNIIKWEHQDSHGKTGKKWLTYLTGEAAEQACDIQHFKLLNDDEEVDKFISYFPWKTIEDKIRNFVKLFGLEKSGTWNRYDEKWDNVDSIWDIRLSRISAHHTYGVEYSDDVACINRWSSIFPCPYVVYKDC